MRCSTFKMDFVPFTDERSSCVKCGSTSPPNMKHCPMVETSAGNILEHLELTCFLCGYRTPMLCKDQQEVSTIHSKRAMPRPGPSGLSQLAKGGGNPESPPDDVSTIHSQRM